MTLSMPVLPPLEACSSRESPDSLGLGQQDQALACLSWQLLVGTLFAGLGASLLILPLAAAISAILG